MNDEVFKLEEFTFDENKKKIIACPRGNKSVDSDFISSKREYYARFSAEQCIKCNAIKQCPVKIKNKFSILKLYTTSKNTLKNKNKFERNNQSIRKDILNNSINSIEKNIIKPTRPTNKSLESNILDFVLEESGVKYIGSAREVVVPKSIDGKIVDRIAGGGFSGKKIRKVILPNTIKSIGRSAFADCTELSEIVIPDSVTNIEGWAFGTCISLKRIELSDNIIEIGSHAFDECRNLEYIRLPEEIDYIGAYAFSETAIKKVVLPKGIKYLGNSLFYECRNLKEVYLSEGVETIGIYTFGNCISLRNINLPDSLRTITTASFQNCLSLTNIRIPLGLEEMDDTSFGCCENLHVIECEDIHKRVVKYNHENAVMSEMGMTNPELLVEKEYDTIFNILKRNTNKKLNIAPLKSQEQHSSVYEEILTQGVKLKRCGKYKEAKNKYIEAIKMGCKKPMAYYNLGKILYILKEYDASVRAYETAFELEIDPYNVLVHLGHSLLDDKCLDGKYRNTILFYQQTLDPYILKKYAEENLKDLNKILRNRPSKEMLDEYDAKCIDEAKKYLKI